MDKVLDITDDYNNLSETDKENIKENFKSFEFSPVPGISITKEEVSSDQMMPTESLKDNIKTVLDGYNRKYGLQFKYPDYENALKGAIDITANEREIRRVIDSQIITNVSEILTTKAILVISKVISDQLDRISDLTKRDGLSAELVGIVGEMFSWVEKLEEIKKKYQLFDVDSRIKSLLNKTNSTNLVRTPEQEHTLKMLKDLLIPK